MDKLLKILEIIKNEILLLSKKITDAVFKVKVVEMPQIKPEVKVDIKPEIKVDIPEIKAKDLKVPPIDASQIKIPPPNVKVEISKIEVPPIEVPKPEVNVEVDLKKIEKVLSELKSSKFKFELPDFSKLVKEIKKENEKLVKEIKEAVQSIKVEMPEKIKAQLISADESEVWDYKDIKQAVVIGGGGGAIISDDRYVSYEPSDEDIREDVEYFGFLNPDGAWKITKHDIVNGTWRYIKGRENYQQAWQNRENLDYKYINEI